MDLRLIDDRELVEFKLEPLQLEAYEGDTWRVAYTLLFGKKITCFYRKRISGFVHTVSLGIPTFRKWYNRKQKPGKHYKEKGRAHPELSLH